MPRRRAPEHPTMRLLREKIVELSETLNRDPASAAARPWHVSYDAECGYVEDAAGAIVCVLPSCFDEQGYFSEEMQQRRLVAFRQIRLLPEIAETLRALHAALVTADLAAAGPHILAAADLLEQYDHPQEHPAERYRGEPTTIA